MGSTAKYYDIFSKNYHLIYDNWDQEIKKQARIIKKIIFANHKKKSLSTILDCTCGIGTQAIGLAQLGFIVEGSDISPDAIRRAKKETTIRNLKIRYKVLDLLQLSGIKKKFDVIISMDNALPHITNKNALITAFKEIKKCLSDKGIFIFSIRDYDKVLRKKATYTPPYFYKKGNTESILMQIWNWKNNNIYEVHQHITAMDKNIWNHSHCYTTYRAYKRQELADLLKKSGFKSIEWLMPEETGYHQPIAIIK